MANDEMYADKSKAYYDMRDEQYRYEDWKQRSDIELGRYDHPVPPHHREADLERAVSNMQNIVMKLITEVQLLRQEITEALKPLRNMDDLKK